MIIKLKSSYSLEKINSETVLLTSDNSSVMLTNTVGNAILLEIAEKEQTIEELQDKFSKQGVAYLELMQVLYALKQQGYTTEAENFFTNEQAAFWETQGFETKLLANTLQEKTIAIQTVGQHTNTALEQACRETGIKLSDQPHLQVVLTDDYNCKELGRLNQKFEKNKTPWMLVKTTGKEIWIGPIFIPGQTACWECLHHRLELHSPENKFYRALKNTDENPSRPHIDHPINNQIGANKALLEIVKWLYGDKSTRLVGNILSIDTYTLEQHYHTVVKRPQCQVCGDNSTSLPLPVTLREQPPLSTRIGGYRAVSHQETFDKYKHHISPISGIIPSVKPYPKIPNAPIFNYASGRNLALHSVSMFWLNHHLRSGTGGKGKNNIQAQTGALCEGIERYSLMYHGNEYSISASLDELEEGIHPNKCMNYSEAQLKNREATNKVSSKYYELTPIPFDASEKMDWSPVYSLSEQKFKYLPSSFCYAQYPAEDEMKLYSYPDSNGCAAGNTLEEAILQGFLELVERDSAAIWWYNRLKRPMVDLNTLDNPYIQEVIQYYKSIDRSLWVLDITSDLGIPVFVAVSHNLNHGKEQILYAFGAHLDASIAIERAIIEVNQILPIVNQGNYLTQDPVFIDWLDTQTIAQNDYLSPLEGITKNVATDYPELCPANIYQSVLFCVETAKKHNLETLVLDLTQKDIGLPVTRVIVPGLRHFWRRTGPGRLYDVPVCMGWLDKELTEEELNPIGIFI